MDIPNTYCSHCCERTTHTLIERSRLQRNVYRCSACEKLTVQCRRCQNMAAVSDRWHSNLCAVHDGTISSFELLEHKLEDLTAYRHPFKPECKDIAVSVAPAIGAVAALTATTGPAPVTPVMASSKRLRLERARRRDSAGFVAARIAAGSVKEFKIEQIIQGKTPAVIVIDGFLTENTTFPQDWRDAIAAAYPGHACYYVRWESESLLGLSSAFPVTRTSAVHTGVMVGKALVRGSVLRAAARVSGVLTPAVMAYDVATNPWHSAVIKAQHSGVVLADLLSCTEGQFILCGHSLGARVIHYALLGLARRRDSNKVIRAHLLGGAVGSDTRDWEEAVRVVQRGIVNYHTRNDHVLKLAYSPTMPFGSAPIGRQPIERLESHVTNVDVSEWVNGHTDYKGNFARFVRAW